jgi:hypothetical protein
MLCSGVRLSAQSSLNCPPGVVGSPSCASACLSCDLSFFDDKLGAVLPQPIIVESCIAGVPPLTLESPRWYRFIAGSPSINWVVKTNDDCFNNGVSLEYAVLTGCSNPPLKALACEQLLPGNPYIFVQNLIVGQTYYLVIDGQSIGDCSYSLEAFLGLPVAPQLGVLEPIQGLTEVCPKATTSYSIPPVQYATNYIWSAPSGSKINGGSNVAQLGSSGTTVDIQFGTVGGSVCVTAINGCDTPLTTCIPIVNAPLGITQLPDLELCFEELPYIWPESQNQAILTPGTFILTSQPFPSFLGCDSIVRQKIKALPRKFKNLPPKWLCKEECFYVNGFEYCEAGVYLEILPADNGCDSTLSFTLFKVLATAAAQVEDTLTCKKTSVLLTSTGSSTGNTIFYRWLNPSGTVISTADTAIATVPGEYSFIVTNFGGGGVTCEDTAKVTVIGNTTPPLADAGPDRVLNCDEPLIQLQGSGSVGSQYTYQWTTLIGGNIVAGGNTLTPTVNAPGTYRLTVTNEINGCTAGNNAKVTSIQLPPSASASGGTFSCVVPNVTLQVTTNGNNPSFAWSGPNGYTSSLQNPVVNVAGSYTVTVTDAVSGCTNAAIATVVSDVVLPGAEATGGAITCNDITVQLNSVTQGQSPVYAWTGPNGFSSSLANPVATVAGTYNLTVTGSNGCSSTASATVDQDNAAPGATLAVPGTLNCNVAAVSITASSNGPAALLTHEWTLPDNSTVSTAEIPMLSADAPGTYSVLITNTQNGCTSTATATVVQNPAVSANIASATNILCFGDETGSVDATAGGGNGSYTYLWSNDAVTPAITGLGAGTYTVTITDGEQCSATATATLTEPTAIVPNTTSTPESTNGAEDGTASASPTGGTGPYTYLWSNDETTASIENLIPGLYTVTITDANNCTAVSSVEVLPGSCGISLGFSVVPPTCNSASDASITVELTGGNGPFMYEWSSMGTDSVETGLSAGNYMVTVTDIFGCVISGSVNVSDPASITLSLSNQVNTMCSNETNGSATVSAMGGTGSFMIAWDNGQTGPTATNLAPGTYTATATDGNGCTAQLPVAIAAVDMQAPVIATDPITAPLGNTGNVTLSVQSLGLNVTDNCGVGSVTFVPSTFNCAQLGPHDVVVTAIDGAGNQTVETVVVTIVDDLAPNLDCPANVVRCFGDNIVEYPAPVAMDNCLGIGGSFAMPSGLPSGSTFPDGITTNTFSYTDANGNTGSCSFEVTILSPLVVSLGAIVDDIDNQNIGSIDINVSGSLAPYSFQWTLNGTPFSLDEDLTGLGMGNYQVIVTDSAGCMAASESFTVKSVTGTNEPGWASGLLIVPNPTSGQLSVIFSRPLDSDVQLTVHDMTGRLVQQQSSSTPKRVDFDLSTLPGGLYKMTILVDNQLVVRKIVVSR